MLGLKLSGDQSRERMVTVETGPEIPNGEIKQNVNQKFKEIEIMRGSRE